MVEERNFWTIFSRRTNARIDPMTATAVSLTDGNAFAMNQLRSENFNELYRSVMAFVEETAAYLDGPGRADSRKLGKMQAYDYVNLTRQVTYGAIRIANLLLTLRSVKTGDQRLASAIFDIKTRKLKESPEIGTDIRGTIGDQPQRMLDLILKCEELRLEVNDLVDRLETAHEPIDNPVHHALGLIGRSFGKA